MSNLHRYAVFISASWNYVPFLNALLCSMEKRGLHVDTYLIGYEIKREYIDALHANLSFPVYHLDCNPADHDISGIQETGKNLFLKQARFRYIQEHGKKYDAIAMLDADMFLTSSNWPNFFDLVAGTRKLIGCEESIKWNFDQRYTSRGRVLFPEPVKALKFHCSVPIVFDLKEWDDVFTTYNDMAFHSYEVDAAGQPIKRVGDIYCWNISVYLNHRQNDCVLFPMHCMTQVHGTAGAYWCGVRKHGDLWYNGDGCECYSIHGRIGTPDWYQSQINWYANGLKNNGIEYRGKIAQLAEASLQHIRREWWELNFDSAVNLYDFWPKNDLWDSMKS